SARGLADDVPKDPAERTQAAEADVEADVGHTSIGCPQQVHGALDPATLEIAVRGLVKGCPKGSDEVRLRYVSHPGEGEDIERLRVGSVHGVARTEHSSVELLHGPAHREIRSLPIGKFGTASIRGIDLREPYDLPDSFRTDAHFVADLLVGGLPTKLLQQAAGNSN